MGKFDHFCHFDAFDGDERANVSRAHARVYALVLAHVDSPVATDQVGEGLPVGLDSLGRE